MTCACGGPFFRQLDTVVVSLTDADSHAVSINPPLIAWGWWAVGKRLVFDVPVAGLIYSDTTFQISLHDQTAMTDVAIGGITALAGSEMESFRLTCDVSLIENAGVTLKCWVDYPFVLGIPATVFSSVLIDTAFHPLLPQILVQQSAVVDSEITFQNIQFSALPKTQPPVC